jgi:hypothetical protein
MITYIFLGFMIAIIVVLVVAIIWGRAKDSLQRWGYNLTRESNRQLRDTELKLESLLDGQKRMEREMTVQTTALRDLHSHLTSQKNPS